MNTLVVRKVVLLLVALTLTNELNAQTTHNVPDDFTTIQAAVDAAVAEDVINVGAGEYMENVIVGTADITINGAEDARIVVDVGETGISISASGVTIQGLEIEGPYDLPYTDIDWSSEPDQTYGIELQSGATDVTILNNQITNVRSGIQVLAGAEDATITDNLIENTKGSILLRSDPTEISGNSIGETGSEWDIVILTSLWDDSPAAMTLLPDQTDLQAYGDDAMALSADNGDMTILDRRFGDHNRSHAVVEEGHMPGPEDDFDLGNGLGNPRQPYGAIQHGVTALMPGGLITVREGTYAPFQVPVNGPADITIEGEEGAEIALDEPTTAKRIADLRADGITFRGFTILGGEEHGDSHVGIAITGQGLTISDNTIDNVLTGIQTTTQYTEGNNEITNNTITNSNVGISLQNNSNVVSGNTIDVEVEGFGIGSKTNTIIGNDLTIGSGGIPLQTYSGGSLPGADVDLQAVLADNDFNRAVVVTDGSVPVVQTIFGDIQNTIAATEPGDVVEVSEGTYDENVQIDHGLTLTGTGADNVTIAPSSGNAIAITGNTHPGSGGVPGIDGVTIENVTVEGDAFGIIALSNANPADEYDTANLIIRNVVVNNAVLTGIGLFDVDGATIENVTINGHADSDVGAFELVGVRGLTITNSSAPGSPLGLNIKDSTFDVGATGSPQSGSIALTNASLGTLKENGNTINIPDGLTGTVRIYGADATLQGAIDDAAADETVIINGIHTGDITIASPGITLTGDNAGIEGRIDVSAAVTTVTGIDITNPDDGYGIVVNGVDGVTITNNTLHDIGNDAGFNSTAQAIYVHDNDVSDTSMDDIVVTGNDISNIGHDANENTNKGIFVGDSEADRPLNNVSITNNIITNVSSSDATFTNGGRGGYGILVNWGFKEGFSGDVSGLEVSNNTIQTINGFWVHGLGLEGDTPNATVTGNTFSDLNGTKVVDEEGDESAVSPDDDIPDTSFRDSAAIFFEGNPNAGTVAVANNKFNADTYFGVALDPDLPAADVTVDASENYWGAPGGPDEGAKAGEGVTFKPWYIDETLTQLSTTPQALAVQTQPEDTQAGQAIAGPPAVLLSDFAGDPVAGVAVTAGLSAGSFSSGATEVTTDADGLAVFDDLVVSDAGSFTLSFSADGVTDVVSGTFNVDESSGITTNTVCAEGCDFSSIQDAIDNTGAGDTILVMDGTYGRITLDKGLTLLSDNDGGAVITGDGVSQGWAIRIEEGVEDVTIGGIDQGFEINAQPGDLAAVYAVGDNDNLLIEGNELNGGSGNAFLAGGTGGEGLTNSTISNNTLTNNGSKAMAYVNGQTSLGVHSSDVTFDQNIFTASGSGNGVLLGLETENAVVTDNTFEGESSYSLLELWNSGAAISGNSFENSGTGAAFKDSDSAYNETSVSEANNFIPGAVYIEGKDDLYTLIQNTIAAAEPGDVVEVSEGTYDESITIDKSLSLLGANAGINPNTGTRNDESTITDNGSISIIGSASGVIIDGFEFTNTEGALAYEHGAILLPPKEDGSTGGAAAFNAFEDITIRNNWFHDLSARPILKDCFATFDGLTITNNRIKDITGSEERSGIKIQSHCEAGSPNMGLTITGNEIYNTTYAGIIVDGIDRAVISNNTIDNVPEHGINVGASGDGNGEITILDNEISNAALPGGTAALRIKGGTYSGSLRVRFNSFIDSRRGIIVESGAALPEGTDIEVHDNTFSNNQDAGILNESGTHVDATNNWWGDDSGPSGGINDPDTGLTANGSGDAVSGNVAFDPFIGQEPAPPAATVSESFNTDPGGGPISFNTDDFVTAVSMEIQTGNGDPVNLSVLRYEDPPQNTDGVEGNVSTYRWIFEISGLDDDTFEAEIRFKLSDVPNHGISDPNNIVIYRRSEPGVGTFIPLPTTYDSGSDELVVTVSGFSEFVMGSESEVLGSPSVVIEGNPGWRMMSAPVTGITVADLAALNLVQGINGLPFDEFGTNLFTSYENGADEFNAPANGTTELTSGQGFIWYMWGPDANEDVAESKTFPVPIEVSGDEPEGNVSLGALGAGWQMIGNPFSEDIDFSQLTDGTEPLGIAGQVWDPNEGSDGSYISTSSVELDDILSVWQGAFIELVAETEVVIPEAAKTTGGVFLKQQKSPASQVGFVLESLDETNEPLTRDRAALLYIHENATTGWDGYDMSKLIPLSQKYATIAFVGERDNDPVLKAQHSLPPDLDQSMEIPLDIQISEGLSELAEISFELSWQREYFPDGWQFSLRDNETGEEVDLTEQSAHSFQLTTLAQKQGGDNQVYNRLNFPEHMGMAAQVMKAESGEVASPRFMLTIVPAGAVSTEPDAGLPKEFALAQNYPNPFNPNTVIRYQLPEISDVRLEVFDMLGRKVAVLVDGERKAAGIHNVTFEATRLSSGVYIYRLQAANTIITKKLTLIK